MRLPYQGDYTVGNIHKPEDPILLRQFGQIRYF
jgi:hypothetical protein